MSTTKRAFRASSFFVLRTPLLPFDAFREWSRGLSCEGASTEELDARLSESRRVLRERLAGLLDRADAREAVFVASPSLSTRLAKWQKDPEGKDGQKIEQALVRYVTRMTGRPTPFGLFSGCSLGAISGDDRTRLALAATDTDRRCARLDFSYVTHLAEGIERMEGVREQVDYVPNTGLYRVGRRVHFTELVRGGPTRRFKLAAVEADDAVDKVLARARGGATIPAIAAALVDDEITQADAETFVKELADANVLECVARPQITVTDAARALASELASVAPAAEAAKTLSRALDRLDALNARPLGAEAAAYEEIAKELEELPAKFARERLFQVDLMRRSPEATLGAGVMESIEGGIAALYKLVGATGEHGSLQSFARSFTERYDAREVPLLEALDEEIGIGFSEPGGYTAIDAPLLAGLPFPGATSTMSFTWGPLETLLARKMEELRGSGDDVLRITDKDLEGLGARTQLPMADSFCAVASLMGESGEAVAAGEYKVRLHYAAGPSGARMIGRFCAWDETLTENVRTILKDEESRRPDAIFAEIVFQPQATRVGNLLLRPPVRDHEIAFHARSGVATDRQIPLSDLTVSVRGGRIVLRSRSRGCEIIPRLTSAHNFAAQQLGVYRFLCRLQEQGITPFVAWSWSFLGQSKHLPRVEYGDVVLAPATWRLDKAELAALASKSPAARFRAAQRLRTELGLPRFIALHDGDNVLPVDLENSLSIDAFIDVVHDRKEAKISEALEHTDGAVVAGPGGGYVHEMLIPMARADGPVPAPKRAARRASPRPVVRPIVRDLPPGSEWLYAKIYCGQATADEVLADVVRPLADEAIAGKLADRWFFIRYADPHPHLRVRLHGRGADLVGLIPKLEARLRPLLKTGSVARFSIDTYQREMERYGGDAGVPICEAIFAADTEASVRLLALLREGGGETDRWAWTMLGIDALLKDFDYDLAARHQHELRRADGFAREFRMEGDYEHALSKLYRHHRGTVDGLLAPKEPPAGLLARAHEVLAARSAVVRPLAAALRAAGRGGKLTAGIDAILGSLVHMACNRMLRTFPRQQELVLHAFLARTYESMLARERKRAAAPAALPAPTAEART